MSAPAWIGYPDPLAENMILMRSEDFYPKRMKKERPNKLIKRMKKLKRSRTTVIKRNRALLKSGFLNVSQ